jgi:hypothetical protein
MSFVSVPGGAALHDGIGAGGTTHAPSPVVTSSSVSTQIRLRAHEPAPHGIGATQSVGQFWAGIAAVQFPPMHAIAGPGSQQCTPHVAPSWSQGWPTTPAVDAGQLGSERQ